jgi:hypothetical protein
MPKCSNWFVLLFALGAKIYALVTFFLAIHQNIDYFLTLQNVYSRKVYSQNVYSDFRSLLLVIFRLYHRHQIPNFMNRTVIKSTVRAWVTAFGLG